MRKFFVSFASPNMAGALRRIARQAKEMGCFDTITALDVDGLDPDFVSTFQDKLQMGVRGFGYWAWKAQAVRQVMEQMEEGDCLLYADAGCHLNPRGRPRLDQYFDMLTPDRPMVVFQHDPNDSVFGNVNPHLQSWPNSNWTKGDLIDYFGVRDRQDILEKETYYATTFLMQKGPQSQKFIQDWQAPVLADWGLIDDSPSKSPNMPGFVEHRHDQSIFSLLCNLTAVNAISSCEIVYPKIKGRGGDWKRLKDYPIHARRDRRDSRSSRFKGARMDAMSYLQKLIDRRQ